MKKIGTRVLILDGMKEIIGQVGTGISHERRVCRVALDVLVYVERVGLVKDDLWESQLLGTLRSKCS
jgi:hypothetical protein